MCVYIYNYIYMYICMYIYCIEIIPTLVLINNKGDVS